MYCRILPFTCFNLPGPGVPGLGGGVGPSPGGALFLGINRHGHLEAAALHKDSVGWIVKRAVRRIGLPPADYTGHSLRAGLATEASRNGASEVAIMRRTGHRSAATLRLYVCEVSLFRDNTAVRLDW